jgi:tetratricopeptide (TPR) repeat protein
MLEASVGLFEKQTKRNKRDTYKYINAYRLLGEQKRNAHEYLTAEELYGKGIAIFENERNSSGFESDENIGKLYSDLADLDYFVSGDNDAALANYENAVNNKHDTSSVRYRIGYIQYQKQNYPAALGSFIRSRDTNESDTHLLLALANTLSLSNDNYVARGYYERLLSILGVEKEKYNVVLPQIREDHADLVDTYMKASNNLGVTFARIAKTTGDSSMNAKSIVNLQESLRAWDAMTRNQATMIRLDGSNLAEQNVKYITHPIPGYEPEIYTEIPRLLYGEEGFQ